MARRSNNRRGILDYYENTKEMENSINSDSSDIFITMVKD
jgi:hypothetical protein